MRGRPVCILCLLLVVFLCVTDWLGFSMTSGNPLPEPVQTWIKKHPESTICGEVVRCQENENYQSIYLRNTYLIYNSEKVSIDEVKVYMKNKRLPGDLPKAGSMILVSGKLEEIEGPRNPGEFNSKNYNACRHIYYALKKAIIKKQSRTHSAYGQFLISLRERFTEILETVCDSEAGAFEAIVLGDKTNLDPELKMRYQMGGIIHILAISGVKTLKLDIPLVPETRINWAFVPLHIAIIYILKLCLGEEIIPRCRFPCSRGYHKKYINWQKKQSFSVSQSYRKS